MLVNIMDNVLNEIVREYKSASLKYPEFHSTHEGYAVLKEELDELWDEVRTNKGLNGTNSMRMECIQVAAMAIKFIKNLC